MLSHGILKGLRYDLAKGITRLSLTIEVLGDALAVLRRHRLEADVGDQRELRVGASPSPRRITLVTG
jgi:uncharacterized membrane protein